MQKVVDVLQEMLKKYDTPCGDDEYMKDGLKHCKKCNKPLRAKITVDGVTLIAPIGCQCAHDKWDAYQSKKKRQAVNDILNTGVTDAVYKTYTFEHDDGKNTAASKWCRFYVDNFQNIKNAGGKNGLLFSGTVGTGKTFLACCIANELAKQGVTVLITNFPKLINKMDGNQTIDSLNNYELLVIDDLGAERTSEFALEQVYNVIDSRYRSGKPLIITTNLPLKYMKDPQNMALERIYDRILQKCEPIIMTGPSRRKEAVI